MTELTNECPNCHELVDSDARFCKHCAHELTKMDAFVVENPSAPPAVKSTSLLLPLVAAAIGLVIMIVIAVGLIYWFRAKSVENPVVASNTNTSVPVLSPQGKIIESKILRGEQLSSYELNGIPVDELRILRNAIFARYGRAYERPGLGDYFFSTSWYKPNDQYNDNMLTATDKSNVTIILSKEKPESAPIQSANMPAPQTLDEEANGAAQGFWDKLTFECGDSTFLFRHDPGDPKSLSSYGTRDLDIFHEMRNVYVTVDGGPLSQRTEAQKLNEKYSPTGIEWTGSTSLNVGAHRRYFSHDMPDGYKGWTRWKDWNKPLFRERMEKKNGKWTFSDEPNREVSTFRKTSCNNIPK